MENTKQEIKTGKKNWVTADPPFKFILVTFKIDEDEQLFFTEAFFKEYLKLKDGDYKNMDIVYTDLKIYLNIYGVNNEAYKNRDFNVTIERVIE